jgi:hypothetical protein
MKLDFQWLDFELDRSWQYLVFKLRSNANFSVASILISLQRYKLGTFNLVSLIMIYKNWSTNAHTRSYS